MPDPRGDLHWYTPWGIFGEPELIPLGGISMCSPAVCGTCRKVTYSGCGMHVEQVLANVPTDQRCTCRTR